MSTHFNVKFFIWFAFIAMLGFNAMAQDVIRLRTGDKVEAIVQEIGADDVKYKKWENQTGPTYTMKKSEIFKIKYANGSEEMFNQEQQQTDVPTEQKKPSESGNIPKNVLTYEEVSRMSLSRFGSYLRTNEGGTIYEHYRSGENLTTIGGVIAGIGGGCAFYGIFAPLMGTDKTVGYVLGGVGGVLLGTGVTISSIGRTKMKEAKKDYINKHFLSHSYTPVLNFGITQSGHIGLTFNF